MLTLIEISEALQRVPFGRNAALSLLYRINPAGDYADLSRVEALSILRARVNRMADRAGFAVGSWWIEPVA